jgi:hypothetical protein
MRALVQSIRVALLVCIYGLVVGAGREVPGHAIRCLLTTARHARSITRLQKAMKIGHAQKVIEALVAALLSADARLSNA